MTDRPCSRCGAVGLHRCAGRPKMPRKPTGRKPDYSRQRRAAKRREDDEAAAIVKTVRQHDVDRDGFCIVANRAPDEARVALGPCGCRSEWAHLGEKKRHKTMRLPPSVRHTTTHTAQICDRHHRGRFGYDGHAFEIEFVDDGLGADGPLVFVVNGIRFREQTDW